jgi:hypothetical protein
MRLLSSFANIHQNETIVVCGCGESLNDFVQSERFITIGVNDVGRKFQPNYLVVVNPRHQFSGDRFRYVETSRAEYLFTQLDLRVKHPNIVKFKLGQAGGIDFSNPNVLNYTNNSPYIALCLAIRMGAKRVGLIGVDFTDNHFFSKTGKHPLAPQFEKINEQYRRLAEAAKARGVEIFNLSRSSRLTAFAKASFREFEILSETPEKTAPLKIVSYATTPVAGVPAILARCISARTEHSARCVWATDSYGNGVQFAGDVEWRETPEKAKSLLTEADLIIVHNGKIAPDHRQLLKNKAILTMAHNYLWNVDEQFVKKGFPGVVVGQYQAALPEFRNWMIVPNPISFWEAEYQVGNKPDKITICYTPSGKHEQYPREHKLYWHSKGYQTTMRVLEKLAKQFEIKLEVIHNRQISHAESIAMKRRSHIVIDECVTGSYHRNSLEGLAVGCVVVNGIGLLPKVAEILLACAGSLSEIPFVSAKLENLEAVLTELIESGKDELVQKGLKNRAWLEENWNFERHWQQFWMPAIEKSLNKINRNVSFINSEKPVSGEAARGLKMKETKQGVSVVIPHGGKKRLPLLRSCLANLRQCADIKEIIVIEMDETPTAAEISRKWADKYVFKHFSGLFERARALDVGSAFAECEFILWLDNDLLMPHDFVSRAVAEMRERNLDFLKPYHEVRYLSPADSEKVMKGVLPPDECKPPMIYYSTHADGGAGLVRTDFLRRFGGTPAGFRGWGGEDNGWTHKVFLLGKGGRTNHRNQKLYHLFHMLSGGNGGDAHMRANPHYQENLALLGKIKRTSNPQAFLENFPPPPIRLWDDSPKIYFVADQKKGTISNLARELFDSFGIKTEIISGETAQKALTKANLEKLPDALVFFDEQTVLKFISADFFVSFIEKTIIVAGEDFSPTPDQESKLSGVFAVLTENEETVQKFEKIKSKLWKYSRSENKDAENLALTLAQPLSLLVNNRRKQIEPKKQTAAVENSAADLPVWMYWEGKCPEWIAACQKTIFAHAPNARLLTPETFDELWDADRDINLKKLHVAHRADFIRAFLLKRYGGVWIDCDCVLTKPLAPLLESLGDRDFAAHRERGGYFGNEFMIARRESRIAEAFYQQITKTLRTKRQFGWCEIGCVPLTDILSKTDAPFLDIECELIQPICWSRVEPYFVLGDETRHQREFDSEAFCYMLSNLTVNKYLAANPNKNLLAEKSFFSYLVRQSLNKNSKNGFSNSAHDEAANGVAKPAQHGSAGKNWRAIEFYLEIFSKLSPKRVLDLDAGLGRWAVLLRDLLEASTDKREWKLSVEAVVETKSKAKNLSRNFYNRIHTGKFDQCLQNIEEKQDLLILGDYLNRDAVLRDEKILEKTLDASDYVLLNLSRNGKNNGQNLIRYFQSRPEQIAAYRTGEDFVSFLLSQNDPKNLRPKSHLVDIFYKAVQACAQCNEESVSGPGSSLKQTAEIRRSLPLLCASFEINSLLDAPCGDYNWLRYVDLKLEKYVGVDIVSSIIEQNRTRYQSQNRKFFVSDVTVDFLPQCDLILCRDCLVHLSFAEISSAILNFCNSGAKYLLITTFPKTQANLDIRTGDWRPLNFQLPPFNFPAPLELLNEHCSEDGGKYADKSLGLWNISEIPRF